MLASARLLYDRLDVKSTNLLDQSPLERLLNNEAAN